MVVRFLPSPSLDFYSRAMADRRRGWIYGRRLGKSYAEWRVRRHRRIGHSTPLLRVLHVRRVSFPLAGDEASEHIQNHQSREVAEYPIFLALAHVGTLRCLFADPGPVCFPGYRVRAGE